MNLIKTYLNWNFKIMLPANRKHFHFKHHGRLLKVKMANMLYIIAKSSVLFMITKQSFMIDKNIIQNWIIDAF